MSDSISDKRAALWLEKAGLKIGKLCFFTEVMPTGKHKTQRGVLAGIRPCSLNDAGVPRGPWDGADVYHDGSVRGLILQFLRGGACSKEDYKTAFEAHCSEWDTPHMWDKHYASFERKS